jgi:dipeptidyl aminopeptidase/acylaminoacyl peptidase
MLISEFIKYQKPYQLAIYPGERHGVRSMSGILHWNWSMIQFFLKNL